MNTMKKIFLTLALAAGLMVSAQVKIGTNATSLNANAVLELESSTKGILFPRVALTGTSNVAPLAAHVQGMTVYNTATAGDVTPGMYTNSGTAWVKLEAGVNTIAIKTANYSLTTSDRTIFMNCNEAALTVTLPAVASSNGRTIIISKIDTTTNALTLSLPVYFSSTESITTLNYNTALTLQCDGTSWWVIAKN